MFALVSATMARPPTSGRVEDGSNILILDGMRHDSSRSDTGDHRSMSANTHELTAAIDVLYRTFVRYPLHKVVDGCPCCVGDADHRRIRTRPLRLLKPEDIDMYARKALTTWGTADDFRHFLPRLFELLALRPPGFTDAEVVFRKLPYAEWRRWPGQEQAAIERYFMALWKHMLTQWEPTSCTDVDVYLCAIGQAIDQIEPYLTLWAQSCAGASRAHLLAYVIQNWDAVLKDRLQNVFWNARPHQMQDVVTWIVSPALRRSLTDQWEADIAAPQADMLAQIIDALEQLVAIRSAAS